MTQGSNTVSLQHSTNYYIICFGNRVSYLSDMDMRESIDLMGSSKSGHRGHMHVCACLCKHVRTGGPRWRYSNWTDLSHFLTPVSLRWVNKLKCQSSHTYVKGTLLFIRAASRCRRPGQSSTGGPRQTPTLPGHPAALFLLIRNTFLLFLLLFFFPSAQQGTKQLLDGSDHRSSTNLSKSN